MIDETLQTFVNSVDYDNLDAILSENSISQLETKILNSDEEKEPQDILLNVTGVLRSNFKLDYDDLIFEGNWIPKLPSMIARNHLLRHFLELGNELSKEKGKFFDATLNTAADDYTGFIDLMVIKIQTLGEEKHYQFEDEDISIVKLYLTSILTLMRYCKDMLDMSSSLRPSLFQMRSRRMEGRIRSVIEMSTYGKDYPDIRKQLTEISDEVNNITNDKALKELQIARNERYKQSKIRLYNYTLRCTEDLNNQLEACDPYDFTHREDLRKQLEQVQIFQRSFDKDR